MLPDNDRQLCHTFLGFIYVEPTYYHEKIFVNNSDTHFLSLILIRNRMKYKKKQVLTALLHIS